MKLHRSQLSAKFLPVSNTNAYILTEVLEADGSENTNLPCNHEA
jgi:hypothetical protein